MIPNVIRIEKNVPMPSRTYFGRGTRYGFIKDLEVGDSFLINGNTQTTHQKQLCLLYIVQLMHLEKRVITLECHAEFFRGLIISR